MDAGTVLVVDDELDSLRLLTDILQEAGYKVWPAATGGLALEFVQHATPDLILLDIRMSGLNGFEICRRLKARADMRDIPLMFISATDETNERIEGLKLGAVDFIAKPFHKEELLARLHTHLELGRLRANLEREVARRTAELSAANQKLQHELDDRRLAEMSLREAEARFRNMADTAPVMIWVSGPDKGCTFCNKVWLEFTGRLLEEELGDGWVSSVHPDDLDRCYQTYALAFDARQRFQMEYRLRRADGEYRWILDTGVPRFEPTGAFAGYIGSAIDHSDVKLNQERMLSAHKLESLGVLAAGVAHDFNNMLGSIFAEADLALVSIPADSPSRRNIDGICATAARASEVLKLLMAYAGGKEDDAAFEAVNLASLFRETLEFLKMSVSRKALIETSFAENCPPVQANPTQIRRVLMNLVTNASEALSDGEGVIRVSTRFASVRAGSREQEITGLREGDYVRLEVRDTGCGIAERDLEKAFDPFYTTKEAGRGLGLSAVQGIVRSHGGAIDVSSAPARGSTFRVFLPCNSTVETKTPATQPAAPEAAFHGKTILLVEDETTLRLAVSELLSRHGFSVLEAGEGRVALDIYRERAAAIDAVLLDLTLPGMSGTEVLEEVRQIRPDAKVVLTSAYDRSGASAKASFAYGNAAPYVFIRKPYRIAELVSVLHAVVRQGESRAEHAAMTN